jgi:hypothetical protein
MFWDGSTGRRIGLVLASRNDDSSLGEVCNFTVAVLTVFDSRGFHAHQHRGRKNGKKMRG